MDDRDGLFIMAALAALAVGHILLGRVMRHNEQRVTGLEREVGFLRQVIKTMDDERIGG
jgi:hypothetical protein